MSAIRGRHPCDRVLSRTMTADPAPPAYTIRRLTAAVGTYRDNYKARRSLEKAGYRASPDPEKVLRAYYSIPEDRLRSSVTYEKTLSGDRP